jgi:hypothetical protein
MIKRILICILAAASLFAAPPAKKPKLLLTIVVDQFRYDYLTRFRSEYKAGFDRLLTEGAVYTNARFEHFPTVTAIGHSTILTGAPPSLSGIVGNSWFDRTAGKPVTSVSDEDTQLVGGKAGAGASPRKLIVSTVGDELKIATGGKARVFGVSLKDRAAILPAGHMANGAFWFDSTTGNFVTSTFYMTELPAWAAEFNRTRPADKFSGAKWLDHVMPADLHKLYSGLAASPFGNDIVEAMAERTLAGEELGKHESTDILTVSFSSNDYVGHAKGPDSPEVHETALRTDEQIGRLLQFAEAQVGRGNVLVVLTADHGVSPVPEVQVARHMPGGRMPAGICRSTIQNALAQRYGAGEWIRSVEDCVAWLNLDLIKEKKLDRAEVNRTAAEALGALPHAFRTFTREQLLSGSALEDLVGRRVMNGYFPSRSADVTLLLEPYWLFGATGTTHGTTFSYDSHVPVIFMGSGVKAGSYNRQIAPNDIAPTLATYLGIETPSGSIGRALAEIVGE